MKNPSLSTCLVLLLFSPIISAQYVEPDQMTDVQELSKMKKWQFNQMDWGVGIDNDHYDKMSLDLIMAFAKDPDQMQRDLSGMNEDATTVTRGAAYYTNISFSPLDASTGTYKTNRELKLGMGIHANKEAMLTYKNEDLDTSIVYCNLQSEITIEGAYLFKTKWGKRIHLYAGIGANVGATFNNEMVLITGKYFDEGEHPSEQPSDEMNAESYEAKSVAYSRIYIPYGIGYGIGQKTIIGLDFKTGVGVQKISGEQANYIKKTGAFILSVKYRFR